MSDDIVKRLRRYGSEDDGSQARGGCDEAADEIERLRGEVAVKRQAEAAAIAAGKRAVELRAALERIAAYDMSRGHDDWTETPPMIARAALAGTESPAIGKPTADVRSYPFPDSAAPPARAWPATIVDEATPELPARVWGAVAPASESPDAVDDLLAYILDSDDDGGEGVFEETVERLARAARAAHQPTATPKCQHSEGRWVKVAGWNRWEKVCNCTLVLDVTTTPPNGTHWRDADTTETKS